MNITLIIRNADGESQYLSLTNTPSAIRNAVIDFWDSEESFSLASEQLSHEVAKFTAGN